MAIPRTSREETELHDALWGTFVFDELPDCMRTGPGLNGTLGQMLDVLERDFGERGFHPLVGLALWNLLPTVEGADLPGFATLLSDVIGLPMPHAQHLRQERPDIFPPFPTLPLVDSRWFVTRPSEQEWQASLTMTALRPFTSFTAVPETWFGRPFWSDLKTVKSGSNGATGTCALHLPAEPKRLYEKKTFSENGTSEVPLAFSLKSSPLDRNVRFEVTSNSFVRCRGEIHMAKAPGRPDATQIQQSRTVEFKPWVLPDVRQEFLAYWLQADTLYLAHQ